MPPQSLWSWWPMSNDQNKVDGKRSQQLSFSSPSRQQQLQPHYTGFTVLEKVLPSDGDSSSTAMSKPMPPSFWLFDTSSRPDLQRQAQDLNDNDDNILTLGSDGSSAKRLRKQNGFPIRTSAGDAQPRFGQADLTVPPGGGIDIDEPIYSRPRGGSDDTLALVLPLLILLSTLLLLLLLFIILVILVRRRARIALGESEGPVDVGREEVLDATGYIDGVEQRWLELQDPATRQGYARAKDWTLSYPPGSQSTDITLSQFLSIQEKGVSAWSFDPDYESNPSVYVEARTEITFLADGEGMAPSEGGGCCVQSNLPLPKVNEVYYWEAKMFNKPDGTNVALGLTTKPYPTFRLPGWSKFSIGYFSADGFKSHNHPFAAQSYGPAYQQGDVIGVGYRPRTGTVFFTRNGKRLEDAFIGLNRYNLFPTVGADGACEIHVNLGQAGFVFIEANVKKWGLAPMVGTLAPPPAYGEERGSILIETGTGQGTSSGGGTGAAGAGAAGRRGRPAGNLTPPPPVSPFDERVPSTLSTGAAASEAAGTSLSTAAAEPAGRSSRPPNAVAGGAPIRPSSLRDTSPRRSELSVGSPPNPPTPHRLDISLHSLNSSDGTATLAPPRSGSGTSSSSSSYFPNVPFPNAHLGTQVETLRAAIEAGRRSPSPPYDGTNTSSSSASASTGMNGASPGYRDSWLENGLGGTGSLGARRSSGRSHAIANAVLGMLGDRGLLTPLSVGSPTPGASGTGTGTGTETTSEEERYERSVDENTRRNAGQSGATGAGGWWSWMTGR